MSELVEKGHKPYLKPYAVYSRSAGWGEGAVLIIAHSIREARKLGFNAMFELDDYLDVAARSMRKAAPWLLEEANPVKYANDQAHCVVNPRYCKQCEKWGHAPINTDGICQDCKDDLERNNEQEPSPGR